MEIIFKCKKYLENNSKIKTMTKFLKFRSTKSYVKDFIKIGNNTDKQKQIDRFCNGGIFLFIYNKIANTNSNPEYHQEKF